MTQKTRGLFRIIAGVEVVREWKLDQIQDLKEQGLHIEELSQVVDRWVLPVGNVSLRGGRVGNV